MAFITCLKLSWVKTTIRAIVTRRTVMKRLILNLDRGKGGGINRVFHRKEEGNQCLVQHAGVFMIRMGKGERFR